jgi:hypothetical protein
VRFAGLVGSENVGMSNRKGSESLPRRKPKVSVPMVIKHGLGGPKGKPKEAYPKGKWVNIPTL